MYVRLPNGHPYVKNPRYKTRCPINDADTEALYHYAASLSVVAEEPKPAEEAGSEKAAPAADGADDAKQGQEATEGSTEPKEDEAAEAAKEKPAKPTPAPATP